MPLHPLLGSGPEFLAIGLNHRDHPGGCKLPIPQAPTVFNKQTSCIAGPFQDVFPPRVSDQLDYEGELGIVVGQASRNMSLEAAAASIFGYVVVDDLSVRDWQFSSPTMTIGKSFDTQGPLGLWIVTTDEIPDAGRLAIVTTVNGEIRQRETTGDMVFDCRSILAFLSRVMTLQPGTIVTTGTPARVGPFRHPPPYLRSGDLVVVEILGLGRFSDSTVRKAQVGALHEVE
jgi:2-keto-4-pentenoate hydratase/2-oxohepta-3-ene-1,7-dioic acid hydratase in catechol pathway